MMALTNTPVPVPSLVHVPPTAGLAVVAQHTPRAETATPPSAVTLPPLVAVVAVMALAAVVVTVGRPANVVNVRSDP